MLTTPILTDFKVSYSDAIFTYTKVAEKPDKPAVHSTLDRCKDWVLVRWDLPTIWLSVIQAFT